MGDLDDLDFLGNLDLLGDIDDLGISGIFLNNLDKLANLGILPPSILDVDDAKPSKYDSVYSDVSDLSLVIILVK